MIRRQKIIYIGGGSGGGTANAITAASPASAAGLLWTSAGNDRTAVATDTLDLLNVDELVITSIELNPTLSADGTWSGITETGTAGTTLAFGDLVYFQAADSRWELTDADADATSGPLMLGICVLAAAGDGSATNILRWGKIRADAKFPTLTIGAPVYVSGTAGAITVTQPSATDAVIRIVGFGHTADVLFFTPSNDYMVHV